MPHNDRIIWKEFIQKVFRLLLYQASKLLWYNKILIILIKFMHDN